VIKFYIFNTDHEQEPSSLGSSLFSKKLEATYLGEQFVVINNWFSGLKIYHNGNLVGQSNQLVVRNKYEPFASVTVVGKKDKLLVEIYGYSSLFSFKFHIKINGDFVAGDKF
jgi:hypothetical protein|tara:strand:+ start:594 stop:929 length:336 start_codon:yes stop_codon:yes gene_type:complete